MTVEKRENLVSSVNTPFARFAQLGAKKSVIHAHGINIDSNGNLFVFTNKKNANNIPLAANAYAAFFKVYMSDIGLLRKKTGLPASFYDENPELFSRFKGALTENFVLNELLSMKIAPYYWRSGNTAEVDFIFEDSGQVIPVEVKSADNVQAKSIREFCRKYSPLKGFKLSLKNIAENSCEKTRMINLPLFLIWGMEHYL